MSSNHVFALVQAPTAWLDETVFSFYSEQEVRNLKDVLVVDIDNGLIWSIKVAGFMIGQSEYDPNYECPKRFAVVPYWSIVVPLTFLSAFLLLTKPRKSSPMKITEPIPAEGA